MPPPEKRPVSRGSFAGLRKVLSRSATEGSAQAKSIGAPYNVRHLASGAADFTDGGQEEAAAEHTKSAKKNKGGGWFKRS